MKNWFTLFFLLLFICNVTYPSSTTPQVLNILFVGDIMLDELPGKLIKRGVDPFLGFVTIFEGADIKVGNLECVVSTMGRPEHDKPFTFRANPRVIPLLKKYFTAMSLANNHSGDYGTKAFLNMLDLFDHQGLAYFGGGRNIRAAHEPIVYDIKGKRVAVLGFDLFMPRSFEALDDRPGVAWGMTMI